MTYKVYQNVWSMYKVKIKAYITITFILIEYPILFLFDFIVQSDGSQKDVSFWHHLFLWVETRKHVLENRAQNVWVCGDVCGHGFTEKWLREERL